MENPIAALDQIANEAAIVDFALNEFQRIRTLFPGQIREASKA